MASIESNIEAALFKRVSELSFSPALPVAWPNVAFDPSPNAPYLRVHQLPNAVDQVTIGDAGYNRFTGLLQVSVMWPLNSGVTDATEIAGRVAAHFKRGTVLPINGLYVRIYRPPAVASMLIDGPMVQIPVTISWACDASNLTTYSGATGAVIVELPLLTMDAVGVVPT